MANKFSLKIKLAKMRLDSGIKTNNKHETRRFDLLLTQISFSLARIFKETYISFYRNMLRITFFSTVSFTHGMLDVVYVVTRGR